LLTINLASPQKVFTIYIVIGSNAAKLYENGPYFFLETGRKLSQDLAASTTGEEYTHILNINMNGAVSTHVKGGHTVVKHHPDSNYTFLFISLF
jgi:hypothetical protein